MKKVLVLGGGRIGAAIAKNLSVDHEVTLSDINTDHLGWLSTACQLVTTDACDDQALAYGISRRSYAEMLANIYEFAFDF